MYCAYRIPIVHSFVTSSLRGAVPLNTPKKILSGLFYSIGSGYVVRIASVGFTIWLKRELGLEPFDAALFYFFSFFMLANCTEGLGWALLHYQDRVDEFRETHLTLNLLLGLALVVICVAIAAGLHWSDPDAHAWGVVALPILAVLYLFKRLSTTSEFSLRKDFEFGRLSLIHGLSTIAALAAALWCARGGLGEWSLLIGGWSSFSTLSAVYTTLFVTAVLASHPVDITRLRIDRAWAGKLVSYCKWIWSGWVLQIFVWHYDKLVIAWMLSDRDLTLYENAWWLMQIPTGLLAHMIFNYTNSLYSRYQHERDRLSDFFTRMASLIVRAATPVAILFILLSDDIVRVFGQAWVGTAPIIVWLGVFAVFRPLFEECYGLLWAVGRTKQAAGAMAIQAFAAIAVLPFGAAMAGVRGVSYAVGAVAVLGIITLVSLLRDIVDVRWTRVAVPPTVGIATMVGVDRLVTPAVPDSLTGITLHAAVLLVSFGATLLILEYRTIRQNTDDVIRILRNRPNEDPQA